MEETNAGVKAIVYPLPFAVSVTPSVAETAPETAAGSTVTLQFRSVPAYCRSTVISAE